MSGKNGELIRPGAAGLNHAECKKLLPHPAKGWGRLMKKKGLHKNYDDFLSE